MYTQIRTIDGKPFAEGSSDNEPTIKDIEKVLKDKDWITSNINIWFDDMMGFWRWTSDITLIEKENN
jgi:hypothetical protein